MSVEQAPENGAQNESTFSAASIFGMLLTLGTCLLLQPQSSLSFKKPREIVGRVLFFFICLNPIACAMEAAIVLHALVLIFWRAIRSYHGNPSQESSVFATNLQAGAAGLLFLRSHGAHARLDERLIEPAPKRGHTVMVLDVITMISVVYTAVKLGASVIPWYFQVITWTYVVDWFLVQLAVMMSHFGSSKEQLGPKELIRSAEYLQQKARVLGFGRILGGMAFVMLMAPISSMHFHHQLGLSFGIMVMIGFNFGILIDSASLMDDLPLDGMWKFGTSMLVLFSLITTINIWLLGFLFYNEEGTCKPDWLDWLG